VVLLASACLVLGLLIGSFLNVVIWRVPRGQSVVRPASRCPACDAPIGPRDNVPVLSWLLLRARCRSCGAHISARYPAIELATGLVFAAMAIRLGFDPALPAFLYLGAVGVALAMIDVDVKRLPDVIVLPSYVVSVVLLGVATLVDGASDEALRALIGMVALYAFYFVLAFIYPAGMGFGDVKLAGVLGLYLGWLGWAELLCGAFLGFLYGGVVGLLLMLVRRAGRKSMIPFGPFMLIGAFTAILWGGALAEFYLDHVVG
jgi:leader peptidase (prepilin peptidase) / N-methyltransferase